MSSKIIVIEDDPDTLDIINYILSDEGYDVIAANNDEPLKHILAIQPALILLDNRLALGGSGHDLCFQLKSDPATRHFPVILVSANFNLEKMAEDCLADGCLKKPFDVEELIALVKRFC